MRIEGPEKDGNRWTVTVSFDTRKEALAFIHELTGKPPPGKGRSGTWVQDK